MNVSGKVQVLASLLRRQSKAGLNLQLNEFRKLSADVEVAKEDLFATPCRVTIVKALRAYVNAKKDTRFDCPHQHVVWHELYDLMLDAS